MTTFESYIHVPRTNDKCTFKLIVATTYISRVETSLNTLILVLLETCLKNMIMGVFLLHLYEVQLQEINELHSF